MKSNEKKTVYYDGACTMCTAFATKIEKSGRSDEFVLKDITEGDLPEGVSAENAQKEMYVTDGSGKIVKNIDGIISIISAYGTGGRILARLLSIPGIHSLAKLGYRFVAKYRLVFFGKK